MPNTKTDPNVQIAKRASDMYAGAAVSQKQLAALLVHRKTKMRNGILKHLGCTETQLKRYAESTLSVTELPEKTRERLNDAAVYSKPWPRKTAAMLYAINLASKRTKRAPKPATDSE